MPLNMRPTGQRAGSVKKRGGAGHSRVAMREWVGAICFMNHHPPRPATAINARKPTKNPTNMSALRVS